MFDRWRDLCCIGLQSVSFFLVGIRLGEASTSPQTTGMGFMSGAEKRTGAISGSPRTLRQN
jgi:hypothetical protein